MAAKPFASSADLGEKTETLEVLADGVYALTAEGDPNVGAIEGGTNTVAVPFSPGMALTLQATSGSDTPVWGGACGGSAATYTLTFGGPMEITLTFQFS